MDFGVTVELWGTVVVALDTSEEIDIFGVIDGILILFEEVSDMGF